MKFIVSEMSHFLSDRQVRKNMTALTKYLAFVFAIMIVFTILFHLIMVHIEGQNYSWLTGFYWTLTVMSTLGFGDITFHTDLGRMFTILVLLSGIVLLMIMLPFTFIRYFYAPWLEAQIRLRAPRSVSPEMKDHVIICRYDSIAPGLIRKLDFNNIPYVVLEPDPVRAAGIRADEISVVTGPLDSPSTYESLRVQYARRVIANAEDTTNTSIILTIQDVASHVPITAFAEEQDSIDILMLSGADQVLPLKNKLGEQLAARISSGPGSAHILGNVKDLQIVEFIVHGSKLVGKTLKESKVGELTGIHVVAVLEHGRLGPVHPDFVFTNYSVPIAVGTPEQVSRLNELLEATEKMTDLVLVIGGGRVGRATATLIKKQGLPVHIVEKDEGLARLIGDEHQVIIGNAADHNTLLKAGLERASAVALTTNNDAVNIYLAVYCRRLRPELHIVSRIERNVEAIYRAGADYVLSYSSLGREYLISEVLGRKPIMVGEGADFFFVGAPASFFEKTLEDVKIGDQTGLIVIAVQEGDHILTKPLESFRFSRNSRLLVLGTAEQRRMFSTKFK